MAKILISFLGTGRFDEKSSSSVREYHKASYTIEGSEPIDSSFVASALVEHFKFDHLFLVGTVKSMWEEVYRYYSEKHNGEIDLDYYSELGDKIGESNYKTESSELDLSLVEEAIGSGSRAVVTPYGLERDEQIEIFRILTELIEELNEGDEVILDITHSFRSIPLFATTAINYLKSLSKKIIFKRVYYGMFEVKNEFDGLVPIVDISTTVELQNWISAAYSFKEFGKGKYIKELLQENKEEIKEIEQFSDAVNINYLHEIKTRLANFQQFSHEYLENPFAKLVVPKVLNSFAKRLNKFPNSHFRFQFELSKWHYENENYGYAYIVFVESIVTFVCEQEQSDWKNQENREEAKKLITLKNSYDLKKVYNDANKCRNNIAHNILRRGDQVQNDINNFPKLQRDFEIIFSGINK